MILLKNWYSSIRFRSFGCKFGLEDALELNVKVR